MSPTYTGGCACGALRYAATSRPIFENHCQCRDCRKRSGTGHGSYLTFGARAEVTITGLSADWRIVGDSGTGKVHSFCPVCGTPVYLAFEARPDLVAIHAGSLDDPDLFAPAVVTYAGRGPGWDRMDPALAAFETMPPG
jgi:hypothetical protein